MQDNILVGLTQWKLLVHLFVEQLVALLASVIAAI